jgi:hypothetical protein
MNDEFKERFVEYSYVEKISLLRDILKELKNNCDVPTESENKLINESIVLVNQWMGSLDILDEPDDAHHSTCYEQIDKKELLNMAEFINDELEKSLYHQFHLHKLIEYKLCSMN